MTPASTMIPMISLLYILVIILCLAGTWKTFLKAGQPGWAAIIPFYNLYVLIKVAGRPGWWLVLMFIPLVNIVIAIIVDIEVAKAFGKGAGFGIGLLFLPFVFFPILGFGDAAYRQAPVPTAPPTPAA